MEKYAARWKQNMWKVPAVTLKLTQTTWLQVGSLLSTRSCKVLMQFMFYLFIMNLFIFYCCSKPCFHLAQDQPDRLLVVSLRLYHRCSADARKLLTCWPGRLLCPRNWGITALFMIALGHYFFIFKIMLEFSLFFKVN